MICGPVEAEFQLFEGWLRGMVLCMIVIDTGNGQRCDVDNDEVLCPTGISLANNMAPHLQQGSLMKCGNFLFHFLNTYWLGMHIL